MLTLVQFKEKLAARGLSQQTQKAPLEFFWKFEMRAAREDIWPYLADTSRLNREIGLAARRQAEKDGKLYVRTTAMGIPQEWLEEPWTWFAGETITYTRHYFRGMAKIVHAVFHIEGGPDSDRRQVYLYFGWQPNGWLWKMFLRASEGIVYKGFARAFAKIDQGLVEALALKTNALKHVPPPLTPAAEKKMHEIREQLLAQDLKPTSVDRLIAHIRGADDLELEPLRVLPLAKAWNLEARELLAICLHATRLGLLKISWDVICPHCRGSRFTAGSLGEIPESGDCKACDIDFTTADANSIEVMFHVHASIRKVEANSFCAAEPSKKHHIRVQQALQAGQEIDFRTELRSGAHRLRFVGDSRDVRLDVDPGHSQSEIDLTQLSDSAKISSPVRIRLRNTSDVTQVVVMEELWWDNLALKPAQVLALPEFRDLFAEEHLSSNVKLFLGEQAILFTDIVGSTKFYSRVGDAKAFAEVRAHFLEVFQEVQKHQGVIVKTIGDAVMATLPSTREAIAAAIGIQERFHAGRADTFIRLRISVHCGPVIAVQLNTGIDYFGSTVNFAAKIQSCADAYEVALSESVYRVYQKDHGSSHAVDTKKYGATNGTGGVDVFVLHVKPLAKAS